MDNIDLELEYDLIETKNSDIISSNDIQNNILNLVKLSENVYLHTLNINQIFDNEDALTAYREFETLARNIFYSINEQSEYFKLMFALIKCMRHEHGLNKRLLSYCLLDILSEYDSHLANKLFTDFVSSQIGCWKDLKYFYNFSCQIGKENNSSVVDYSIKLANEQLKTDLENYPNNLSNVAKWIPREKTKYNKLYEKMAIDYFSKYNYSTENLESKKRAINKAKMKYRQNLSLLNKQLDTVQIKQCSKVWQKINPKNQTSRTIQLQINSFLNLSNKYELCDRIICSQNFMDEDDAFNSKAKKSPIVLNDFNDLLLIVSKYSFCDK